MKVAVCLSGAVKHPHKALASIQNIVPNDELHVFMHTWNIKNRANYDTNAWSKIPFENNLDYLANFKATKLLIEDYDNKMDVFQDQYDTLNFKEYVRHDLGVLSMFYGISQSVGLKRAYEKENNMLFDTVIRMRYDSDFNGKTLDLEKLNKHGLYIPAGRDYDGINDQFALGDTKTMNVYAALYDEIKTLTDIRYHPETLLKFYLQRKGVDIHRFDLEVGINNAPI